MAKIKAQIKYLGKWCPVIAIDLRHNTVDFIIKDGCTTVIYKSDGTRSHESKSDAHCSNWPIPTKKGQFKISVKP